MGPPENRLVLIAIAARLATLMDVTAFPALSVMKVSHMAGIPPK